MGNAVNSWLGWGCFLYAVDEWVNAVSFCNSQMACFQMRGVAKCGALSAEMRTISKCDEMLASNAGDLENAGD
jgi:hypothetical protein